MTQHIAYLGPSGTYSEQAARLMCGEHVAYTPCPTLDEVVRQVEHGKAAMGVLPIENSTEGSVHRTLDLLASTALVIQQELVLPIRHQLLSSQATLGGISEVWAHPQALAQCRGWLLAHLPHATQHAATSNGEAARLAAGQPHTAAIASSTAAALYGLRVLAKNIADSPRNTTRFVAVGRQAAAPTGRDRTSLLCSLPNRAGSLYGLLGIFARHGVNLTKLESRPSPEAAWEYVFYIDCDGHAQDTVLAATIHEVQAYADHCKLLGSYPRAEKEQSYAA